MAGFKSCQSYYTFSNAVQRGYRYIYDKTTIDFLETIRETCKCRIITAEEGIVSWRSQLGNRWIPIEEDGEVITEEPFGYAPERMKPLKYKAKEGRANPKGIPYLYLATDKETTMSEVRPTNGSLISVAQFKILKDLRLVDCSSDKHNGICLMNFFDTNDMHEPHERELSVWSYINKAFSEPIALNDDEADYIPTQILSEVFKSEGYDGMMYKSMLGEGHNVVLFNVNTAELIYCQVFKVKSIKYEFEQTGSPYVKNK